MKKFLFILLLFIATPVLAAWQVTITEVDTTSTPGLVHVHVIYTDGKRTVDTFVRNVSDPASIKQLLKNQIDQFEKIDAIAAQTIPLGVVDFTDPVVTPPEPAKPTPEQIYAQKRSALTTAKQDLDLGLVDQAAYEALATETKAAKAALP